MLIFDFHVIGNKLLALRKKSGFTQSELAEAAGIAERTYADIERGTVNMRVETLMRICETLHTTPDSILTQDDYTVTPKETELIMRLDACGRKDKDTALRLLDVYLRGLE